ncbi:DUF5134 domain-containing protein [Streptomyces sp. NPDC048664]|uniref:DUF5134 domain-containing protein n=1 Tax=Streptomyces sp. NPDC048664 TaxID=3154505 RepID=UPI0034478D0F
MHGPTSPGWLLVALCAATGAYCLLRMRSRLEEQRRAAGGEALMGFAMAVMALPATVVEPPRWAWIAYAVVFGTVAVRTLATARGSAHHLHHLVGAFAMAYMAAAMAAGGRHGHGGGTAPVTGVLLAYFAGYVLWSGVRLVPVAAPAAGGGVGGRAVGWGDRPELALACRLAMAMAMLAMLLAV